MVNASFPSWDYDPVTGKSGYWRQYETICNWHSQVLSYWANNGWDLADSIGQADYIAAALPPGKGFPALSIASGWDHLPGWEFEVDVPSASGNTTALFNPAQHLKFAGFSGLRFKGTDSYNRLEDWSHP